ncbi:hypothetical protein IAD21_00305 [Abditibacteriota bacterium]|nr:hypothetical protein IAD21_00305 [Abditibacteriota bacterium]
MFQVRWNLSQRPGCPISHLVIADVHLDIGQFEFANHGQCLVRFEVATVCGVELASEDLAHLDAFPHAIAVQDLTRNKGAKRR